MTGYKSVSTSATKSNSKSSLLILLSMLKDGAVTYREIFPCRDPGDARFEHGEAESRRCRKTESASEKIGMNLVGGHAGHGRNQKPCVNRKRYLQVDCRRSLRGRL